MPGTKQQVEQRKSKDFNYFGAGGVGVEKDGDEQEESRGGGDKVGGAGGGGEFAMGEVHDLFFEDDENLGYLEKIYLFARSKAVFHRYVSLHLKGPYIIGIELPPSYRSSLSTCVSLSTIAYSLHVLYQSIW